MAGILDWILGPQAAQTQPTVEGQPGAMPGYMVDPVTGQTYNALQILKAQNKSAPPEMLNGMPEHRAALAAGMPVNADGANKASDAMPAGSMPQPPSGGLLNSMGVFRNTQAQPAESGGRGFLHSMGDAMISLGNPYGGDPTAMTDPRQRQIAIGQALFTLGSGISNSRARDPLGSLGDGVRYAQAQGLQSNTAGLQRAMAQAQLQNLQATTDEKRQKVASQRAMATMFGVPMPGGVSGGAAGSAMPPSAMAFNAPGPAISGSLPNGGATPSMPEVGGASPSNFLQMVPPEYRSMAQAYAAAGDYEKAFSLIQKGMGGGDDLIRYDPKTGSYAINPLALQAKSAVAAAGRPNINTKVEIAGETEAAKIAAKDHAEVYGEVQKNARNAAVKSAYLKQLDALLDQVDTGSYGGTITDVKALGKRFNIDLGSLGVGDDVAPAQAARALANQLALQMRSTGEGAGMPGAMSDKDREFLVQMIPGLETTREGRKLMMQFYGRMNDYNRGLAKAVQDYVAGRKGVPDHNINRVIADYADKNPIFSEADLAAAQQAARPKNGGGGNAGGTPVRARGPNGEIIELDPATNQWKRIQ